MVEPGSGQILRSNLAARENLGFKAEELHRKQLSDIDCQHSSTEILQRLSAVESGESGRCDFYSRHRRADNSEYPVQVFIYPSTWQGNRALVVLVLDTSGQTDAPQKPAITGLIGESSTYGLKGGWQLLLPGGNFYWTEEVFTIHGIHANPDSTVTLDIALQFYLPESQQRLRKRLTEATADPASWQEELTLSTAGLTKKRLRISSYPQFKDGNLVGFFGSVEDLTEPAPTEDLTGSPLAYEQVVNAAPYGIFQLDAKNRLLTVNASGALMLEQPSSELTGKDFLSLIKGAEQPLVERALNQALAGKGSRFELSTPNRRLFNVSAYPLRHETRDPPRLILICQDITQEREVATAIANSEKKYRTMIDSSPDSVILHAPDGAIIDVNPAACELLGFSRSELLDRNFADLDNDWFEQHFAAARRPLGDGLHFFGESTLLRADQTSVPCEYHSTVTSSDNQPTVLHFIRDISARLEREQQQREMVARVQQSQKLESLGVLAGGIAHDFNNLLTSMLGNANLARTAAAHHNPAVQFLENIEAAAIRAGELCTQMLTYAGQGRFAIEETDLNGLIIDMTRLLELAVSNRAVLKYQLTDDLPAAAIDSSQIRQALMSMVINASEALGDNSGMVTINTGLLRADRHYLNETYLTENLSPGDYLFIEVSDNGGGMSSEIKSRIFDPFFSTKFTGRGLGLAAVLGIVRSHDGALKVYSEEGRGTTFKMLLPIATAENQAAEASRSPKKPSLEGTVLIADDELSVATVTAQMVEALGMRATIAHNGRECVEIFQNAPQEFDLVLLDLSMPELDGAETFHQLKILHPTVKVVLTSGFNEEDAAQRFNGKGLTGFLQKPYHLTELREKIEAVLGEKGRGDTEK